MPAFQYNPENQKKFTPTANEPFLKNVPKDKVFVPTPGVQHRLRFLPPWSSTGLFARFARTHWRVGGQGKAFACPDMWEEGTCPFCKVWAQIRPQYDLYQQDVLAIRPTPRYYSNVINVQEPAKGVQVYTYGKRVYQMIKGIQDSGSFGDITDAINGCDLILQRTGAGMQVQDVIYPVPQHSPIQNPDWLDQLFNLDDIFNRPDMEEVEVCFKTHPWRVYNPNGTVAAAGSYPGLPSAIPPPPAGWMQPPANQRFTPPTGAPILAPTPPVAAAPVSTQPPIAVAQPVETPAPSTMANIQSLEDKIRAKLNATKPAN
jgi:hypothetical protein